MGLKLSTEVSSDKLRGGFYSPDELVALCWSKVQSLLNDRDGLRVLEPSAGDGAFIRGLALHELRGRVSKVEAVELLEPEGAKALDTLRASGLPGEVHIGSFMSTHLEILQDFDVAVGNPPYLRYQFIDRDDLLGLNHVEERLGEPIGRRANLWIPLFLSAIMRLREGGVFSFILPAEFLTGVSAAVVRGWLTRHAVELQVEMFPPRSFPGVLQEVVVVSGRIDSDRPGGELLINDHVSGEAHRHELQEGEPTWTAFTLAPSEMAAFRHARLGAHVVHLDQVARIGVSTVTGANDYFTYDDDVRERYSLTPWSRELLSRTRLVPGLEATRADWDAERVRGVKSWMLDTAAVAAESEGLQTYVEEGEAASLHTRFKTRIRTPWYKVPVVAPRPLLLSKRSHNFPRLIANTAGLLTTDTIYQGAMRPGYEGEARTVVGSFHNSLTLLTAEIEGRSFGGGVLELVPSEIARLSIFDPRQLRDVLTDVDSVARAEGYESDAVVATSNRLLLEQLPALEASVLDAMEAARQRLLQRRLARN